MQKVNRERLTSSYDFFVWLAPRTLLKDQEKGCTALVESTQLTIALSEFRPGQKSLD